MRFNKPLVSVALMSLALSMATGAWAAPKALQAQNYQEPAASAPVHVASSPVAAVPPHQAIMREAGGAASGVPLSDQEYRTQQVLKFILSYNRGLTYEQGRTMAEAIMEFSNRYHVDFRLLTGVIAVESSFRTDAVSSSGAIGLGQLKPETAKWLGVANPYDPVDNIAGTTRFLSWLLTKYNGSLDHAVSAYYQGPGTVDRQGITPKCEYYLSKVNRVLGTGFWR